MEIWNNVFMEYYRDDAGKLTKLSKQNVDTGMGFERMCTVLQQKSSVYETDLFQPMIKVITSSIKHATHKNFSHEEHDKRVRIIADHARTSFMLINDGLIPSNVGTGYVLRMIIRRMTYNLMLLRELSTDEYQLFIADLLASVQFLRPFKHEEIMRVMMNEITLFHKTIKHGMQILATIVDELKQSRLGTIDGEHAFKLYDTYGFPLELTKEIAKES